MALGGNVRGIRSTKKDKLCEVLLYTIRHDNHITTKEINTLTNYNHHILNKLLETGLFIRTDVGHYEVDLEVFKQCSYVIPDDLWEKLGDREYVTTQLRGITVEKRERMDRAGKRKYQNIKAAREEGRKNRPQKETGELTMRDILFPKEDK